MKVAFSSIVLVAASQLVGCASIVNGQNQSVSVEARSDAGVVTGATCRLSNNKGEWFVTSPGSTMVHRSYEDLSVKCEKEPHLPGLITVKSSTKGMAFGNILFGGVIGAGVDISTGAAYDYPNLITVVMGTTAAAAPAPMGSAPPAAGSPAPTVVPTASPVPVCAGRERRGQLKSVAQAPWFNPG